MSKKMNKRAQSKKKLNQLKKTIQAKDSKHHNNKLKVKKTINALWVFWTAFIPFYLYLIYRLFELDNYLF